MKQSCLIFRPIDWFPHLLILVLCLWHVWSPERSVKIIWHRPPNSERRPGLQWKYPGRLPEFQLLKLAYTDWSSEHSRIIPSCINDQCVGRNDTCAIITKNHNRLHQQSSAVGFVVGVHPEGTCCDICRVRHPDWQNHWYAQLMYARKQLVQFSF